MGFTILNCFGLGRTAKVQNVLTATKIVVIVSFIALGFLAGSGHWEHFSMPTTRTSTTALPAQFVISLLWVMVSYSGWNAATYVAEELRRPERTLPAEAEARFTGFIERRRRGEPVAYVLGRQEFYSLVASRVPVPEQEEDLLAGLD